MALQESVKGKWDGDVDLGDGKLKELRAEYDTRKADACIQEAAVTRDLLELKIRKMVDALQEDQRFLADGLKEASFAASPSCGTKPPCWRAKVALVQDK